MIGNLGGYQILTTVAKKVGGPQNLIALTATAGHILFTVGEKAVKTGIKMAIKA